MRTYILIQLDHKFFCYDSKGRYVNRFVSCVDVCRYMDKIKRCYHFHRVDYTTTCLDEVVIVSFN